MEREGQGLMAQASAQVHPLNASTPSVLQPHDIFLGRGGLDSGGVAYMFLGGMVSEDRVISSTHLHHRIHTSGIKQAQVPNAGDAGEYSSALSSSGSQ